MATAKTERNKEIVRLRFEEELTLNAIGDLHGITIERVRQIVNRDLDIKPKRRVIITIHPNTYDRLFEKVREDDFIHSVPEYIKHLIRDHLEGQKGD